MSIFLLKIFLHNGIMHRMEALKKLNDRPTSLLYRIARWLIWLFFPKFRITGVENLPDEPCVIVGNHSQMYGPVAGEIYTPVKHAVWCAGEMMHREEVATYAFQDFWSGKPERLHPFYRLLSHLVVPLSLLLFNNAHTIAVYHDGRLISTFRNSISALQDGSSIVIFPECYDEYNNIVHRFQDKFIDLARFYYKKTGKALCFVPVYIAPALSLMTYGTPVRFRPDALIEEERRRICSFLMDGITALAVSLPEHTVVPYPNISKKLYPKNLPLEVPDP